MNDTSGTRDTGGPADKGHWGTSWYEQRRFDLIAAMLPREFYSHVFDPACGSGELSAVIAARCEYLLATDRSADQVAEARQRLAGFNADVHVMDVRRDWPERRFDLVVLCELLPHLAAAEADDVLRRAMAYLVPEGHLVVGQWRRRVDDAGLTGDDVSALARAVPGTCLLARYEDPDYVIDVLGHEGATTPAEEGA